MSYVLQQHRYHVDVLVKGADRPAARVHILLDKAGLYPVWQPLYTTHDQRGMPRSFIRRTAFGELRILQDWNFKWFALRDGEPLLCKYGIAAFFSFSEAQRVADQHLCNRSKTLSEGHDYSWPDPEEEQEFERKLRQLVG
jgi:hypothetical protein